MGQYLKEILKFARASALGSAVFVVLALVFMPTYFWPLGILAGIAFGYLVGHLGYDFREAIAAVPESFKDLHEFNSVLKSKAAGATDVVWQWVRKYQAYIVPGYIIGLPLVPYVNELARIRPFEAFTTFDWVQYNAAFVILPAVCVLLFLGLNLVGTSMAEKGDLEETRYLPVLRYNLTGLMWVVAFFSWYLWKSLGLGLWTLTLVVHSDKRVACGVDSVVGGAVTLVGMLYATPTPFTIPALIVAVFVGALVGGALGVASAIQFSQNAQNGNAIESA